MKYENISVYNIENAIRGMRNPMMSHGKSDSYRHTYAPGSIVPDDPRYRFNAEQFEIGANDMKLAKTLVKAGEPHRKFLRQIFVSVDITAPMFWMLELDTYRVGCTMDCSSTMHTITSRPLTLADFDDTNTVIGMESLHHTIVGINSLRGKYIKAKDDGDADMAEDCFLDIKRNLPSSYLYHFTWTANYEVLANIYKWRKEHRLPHWRSFCNDFIKTLPYSELITGEVAK